MTYPTPTKVEQFIDMVETPHETMREAEQSNARITLYRWLASSGLEGRSSHIVYEWIIKAVTEEPRLMDAILRLHWSPPEKPTMQEQFAALDKDYL